MMLRRGAALLLVFALGLTGAAAIAQGARDDAGDAGDATTTAATTRIDRQLAAAGETRLTDTYPPPKVTARGWIVYDATANEAVTAVEPTTPRPIASLAKLMTALVVLDAIEDLGDELVTIPAAVNDLPADAARMDARAGEQWPASDLLRATLTYSANDAALALALHVSDGDQAAFVQRMNAKAEELGLTDSEFASATGFDEPGATNRSTPVDLVVLAKAVLAEPEAAAAVAEESVALQRPESDADEEPMVLPNRNPLIGSYDGVDGVKTGFTDAAGYMLITHHVEPDTKAELIVVTMASRSEETRASDARALLDWARPLRTEVRVIEGGMPLGSLPVEHSRERLTVFACDDLLVNARVGQRLQELVTVPGVVVPPVRVGDEIGELTVRTAGATGADAPLPATVGVCAGASIAERTRVQRLVDEARDWRGAWQTGIDEVGDAFSGVRERIG